MSYAQPNNWLTGGRLSGVQIPDVGFVTIGDYNWNRPTTMTLPGGTKKEYEYDPLMRVKRITARDPGQNVFLNYEYTHDNMDNIIDKDTEHGDYGYEYDDLYRLTTADNPDQDDEAVILSEHLLDWLQIHESDFSAIASSMRKER